MKIYKKIILAIGPISAFFAPIVLTSCGASGARINFIIDKNKFYKTNGTYEFIGFVPENYQEKSVDRILFDFKYTKTYTSRNFKNIELFKYWIMDSYLLNTHSSGSTIEAKYQNFNFSALTNMEVLFLSVYQIDYDGGISYAYNFLLSNEWNSNVPIEICNFKWIQQTSYI